jgi:hypothetical protein
MNATKPFRGGRVFNADAPPADPNDRPRIRNRCFADGCPMPGTMWTTQLSDGNNPPGSCAWHYGVVPSDIPKVTRVLLDWQCVSYEVNEARRALTGQAAADPAALDALYGMAVERLKAATRDGGWGDTFGRSGDYSDWMRGLQAFLGAKVLEVLSVHRRRAA